MSNSNQDKLPPNQFIKNKILKWGSDHRGIVKHLPEVNREKWHLIIDGLVEHPQDLSWDQFNALPMVESISDFHCVETWSVLNQKWTGVPFSEIIKIVNPKPEAKFVWFECADGYTTSLPIDDLKSEENILAIKLNGELLDQGYGGPLRLVVPQKYAYKSAMYLVKISFIEKDKLGFWEQRGYSNSADVWKDDRYS